MDRASTRRGRWAGAVALLLVSACSSADSTDDAVDDPAGDRQVDTNAETPEVGNPFVQDLWIYESLRTVDATGEIVDHTAAVVDHVSSLDLGDPVELLPGMTFAPVGGLSAQITGPDGDARPDTTAVAGLVENETGTAFAVLGTVAPDGDRQLGHDDSVFVDMTFLGEAVALGDVVSADLVLAQFLPTDDESEVSTNPLDLLAHRSASNALQYTADDDGDVAVVTGQLGTIVSGSTGPELPVKSSNDMLDGFRDGIKKCRASGLRCVSGYFQRFGDGATSNFEQNMDQLDPDPPPPPPPLCTAPPCGRSTGDPHLTTFDGHYYGMQAVGEFVLARHDADGIEVQIRTSAINEHVSRVERVAIGVGDERILVAADDVIASVDPLDGVATMDGDGFTLTRLPTTTVVETVAGHTVSVRRHSRGHLDVVIAPNEADGAWLGLLGDADGDESNDLTARSGHRFDLDLDFDQLYDGLVDGWRLTDAESLFDYADGEATATFTDPTMPERPFSVADLDDASRIVAAAACQLAGIQSDRVMEQCILDFASTGDIDYLNSARLDDALDALVAATHDGGSGTGPAERAAWSVSGENVLGIRGNLGSATHECPPNGAGDSYSLYGDGVYHLGSSVCAAAVHSGEITVEDGGTVTVTSSSLDDGEGSEGVERNGFSSGGWSGPGTGFVVSAD